MIQLTRIIAVVVDTNKAVLYKRDGNTLEIMQGDDRLRPILEHITPLLSKRGFADIDLTAHNSWKEFEEKSRGFRFFKIAKDKLKSIFSSSMEPVVPQVVGVLPNFGVPLTNALEEIMEYATSVTSMDFDEGNVATQRPTVENGHTPNDPRTADGKEGYFDKHKDTIVAVTPEGKIIPGVERIKSQFTAAAKNSSTKGLEVFLTRLAKVIDKRKHTVEDLLRFMERGDLPVAEDGSIIIFKKLYRDGDHFVDSHTRNVKQKVGSYVFMNESLVDTDRRNECSNGLHVARRGYVRGFSGNAIVMAKVRPEDVIAVPDYDANKMRVSGYFIIAELTPAQFRAINNNQPISDAEGGGELLADAISGGHCKVLEHVQIRSSMGRDVSITPLTPKKASSKARHKEKQKPKTTKSVRTLESDNAGKSDHPVDLKKVAARAKDSTTTLKNAVKPKITQKDIVLQMWAAALSGDKNEALKLMEFKKKAKKGWATWDLDPSAGDTLKALTDN